MTTRRSPRQIEELMASFEASGLSQSEYCRQTGTAPSTLGRYVQRYASKGQKLVRVEVEPRAPEPTGSFTLVLGNGRRIECDWRFTDPALSRLIRVAEGA